MFLRFNSGDRIRLNNNYSLMKETGRTGIISRRAHGLKYDYIITLDGEKNSIMVYDIELDHEES